MMVYFVDEDIEVSGHPCRRLYLPSNATAWVRVLAGGYCTRLVWDADGPCAKGFERRIYGDWCVLRYCGAVACSSVLAQQTIGYGGGYQISVVAERDATAVWLEGHQLSLCLYLPLLAAATIAFSSALGAAAVYGPRVAPRCAHNPQYGVLLDMGGQVLWQGDGVDFALAERWMVQCAYADMRGHAVQRHYAFVHGILALDEQMCRCTYAQPTTLALVPHLFVEALLVGDEEEARGYLSPPLAAQWQQVRDYVGTVASLDVPPYLLPDDQVAWADAEGKGKRFAFSVVDGRIDDLCRVDV